MSLLSCFSTDSSIYPRKQVKAICKIVDRLFTFKCPMSGLHHVSQKIAFSARGKAFSGEKILNLDVWISGSIAGAIFGSIITHQI